MIKQKVDISKRYHYNLEICRKLMEYFSVNQDIRFFQALQILNLQKTIISVEEFPNEQLIYDNFYEESEVTLDKLLLNKQ